MTYHELYVLNTAIDGEDIYSVKEFSNNRLPQVTIDMIKDSLIQKGYLEDYSMPTTQGAKVIRLLQQFKEAKKYITILDMIIGCINDKKGILLKTNNNDEYFLSPIKLNECTTSFIQAFPDLLSSNSSTDTMIEKVVNVNPRKLLTDYPMDIKSSFTIMTDYISDKGKNTKELFFEVHGMKYYYNCNDHMLHETNSKELVELIRKRMEVL